MNPSSVYRLEPVFEFDDRRPRNRRRVLTITAPVAVLMYTPANFEARRAGTRLWISIFAVWRWFVAALCQWRQRSRSRRELLALNDHMLKDIGLTRIDAQYEAAKPFWR